VIEFHLDARSGVSPYQQIVRQVRQALRLGLLDEGDQLPTVKEVVERLAINPNTVLKAYRELDLDGLVEGRRGQGTFVSSRLPALPPDEVKSLRTSLQRWIERARAAGLDEDTMAALFADTVRPPASSRAA
jgi:GntR family transcriptional regulator